MKTKEEVQVIIQLLSDLKEQLPNEVNKDWIEHMFGNMVKLQIELPSIQDLEEKAFNAAREYHLHNTYKFDSYKDYLKENEN